MSEDTTWSKRCQYAALANILSVMSLAFVLASRVITLMNNEQAGDISPSLLTVSGAKYHVVFLFVAIVTLLIRKKASLRVQQVLFALNLLLAVYMFINVASLWLKIR